MTPDEELMVIFGALHVVALALGVVLFMMFLRSDSASSWKPPEDEEGGGGGGNDRLPSSKPKPRPTGGVPLPDAEPVEHAPARPLQAPRRPPAPAAPAGASARAAPHAGPRPLAGGFEPDRVGERQQRHPAAGERPLAPHAHALDDRQRRAGPPRDAARCRPGA